MCTLCLKGKILHGESNTFLKTPVANFACAGFAGLMETGLYLKGSAEVTDSLEPLKKVGMTMTINSF